MRGRGRTYATILSQAILTMALLCVHAPVRAQATEQLQQFDAQLQDLRNSMSAARESSAALGADAAGHTLAADVDALVLVPDTSAQLQALRTQATHSTATGGDPASVVAAMYQASALLAREARRLKLLQDYWKLVPAMRYLRDLWQKQLALAPVALAGMGEQKVDAIVTASTKKISALEQSVLAMRGQVPDSATAPSSQFAALAALVDGYNAERQAIPALISSNAQRDDAAVATTPRTTACPPPAAAGARDASDAVKTVSMGDPASFYPPAEEDRLAEGRVLVTMRIAASGCMTHSGVDSSSGDPALDAAALRLAETGVFLPALRDGAPVEAYKKISIRFLFKR
jgi:TonB family protein